MCFCLLKDIDLSILGPPPPCFYFSFFGGSLFPTHLQKKASPFVGDVSSSYHLWLSWNESVAGLGKRATSRCVISRGAGLVFSCRALSFRVFLIFDIFDA